jgi:hypothetical protein
MPRPTPALVDLIAPPRAVDGLQIVDTRGVYVTSLGALADCLRIHRGGPNGAELVATKRHYDGGGDRERAGFYANIFVIFRPGGTGRIWRTQGVRVLPFEAARIARALERDTASKPAPNEEPRLAGTGSGNVTQLRAEPVAGGVLLYVRFRHGSRQELVRSRGVEVRTKEREQIAEGLRELARQTGS